MSGYKYKMSIVIVLISIFSIQAFAQQINYGDSLNNYNYSQLKLKPTLNYSIGTTFIAVPHWGGVTGITLTPYLSVPLSPKLSVDGGIIAGRYYSSIAHTGPESAINPVFNEVSLYASAIYHFNSQLTLYGSGFKQLTGTSPYSLLPKSTYTIGSTYNFGSFSIGVALQMSQWNNVFSPFPVNGSQGFYLPYEQIPGRMTILGP